MKKRILGIMLTICMVISIMPASVFAVEYSENGVLVKSASARQSQAEPIAEADGVQTVLDITYGSIQIGDGTVSGYDTEGKAVTVADADGYIITGRSISGDLLSGSLKHNTVRIEGIDTKITVEDLCIKNENNLTSASPIEAVGDITLYITLKGANELKAGSNAAGIQLSSGANLTVEADSTGSLSVQGGRYSAAIGTGDGGTCGDITVNGGTIEVAGGQGGAGIGTGYNGGCGYITVAGGEIKSFGGPYAAAIGCGSGSSMCKGIYITDGTVYAISMHNVGGGTPADIGNNGQGGTCGPIYISGGRIAAPTVADKVDHFEDGLDVFVTGGYLDYAEFVEDIKQYKTWDTYPVDGYSVIYLNDGSEFPYQVVEHEHSYSEDNKAVVQPSCTEEGYVTGTCDCGLEVVLEHLDILQHSMTEIAAKAPTPTSDGNNLYYQCSRCQKYYKDNRGGIETAPSDEIVFYTEHDLVLQSSKEPTCTEEGYITHYTCNDCEDLYVDDAEAGYRVAARSEIYIAALKHDMDPVQGQQSTATEHGYGEHYICNRCKRLYKDLAGTKETTEEAEILPLGDGVKTVLDVTHGPITIGLVTVSGSDVNGNPVTAYDPDGYIITGTSDSKDRRVTISGGVQYITVRDLSIKFPYNYLTSPFSASDTDLILTLEGTNQLEGAQRYAGLSLVGGASLTVTAESTGSLTAIGGYQAPGIGSDYNATCGNILICGGKINATGGASGSAIGSGVNGTCGTIAFEGGNITATLVSSSYAPIGAGMDGKCGDVIINAGRFADGDVSARTVYGIVIANDSLITEITDEGGGIEVSRCIHVLDYDSGKTPTCVLSGYSQYWVCSICMCYYSDDKGADRVSLEDLYLPATGQHAFADGRCTSCNGDGVQSVLDISYGSITIGNGTVSGYDISGNAVTNPDPDGYVLTGSSTTNVIAVSGDTQFITLDNLSVDVSASGSSAAMLVSECRLLLTLTGDNTLGGGSNQAGLGLTDKAELVITSESSGTLNAFSPYGCGIGAFNGSVCGDICIAGGAVAASGDASGYGYLYGVGIGAGQNSTCGDILISGGRISASVLNTMANKQTYTYGVGIGAGTNGKCGRIAITGGEVTAKGMYGIGARSDNSCAGLVITGGSIAALRYGNDYYSGISGGKTISTVNIMGGCFASATTSTGYVCGRKIADGYEIDVIDEVGYPYCVVPAGTAHGHSAKGQGAASDCTASGVCECGYVIPGKDSHSFTTKTSGRLVYEADCITGALYNIQCDNCAVVSENVFAEVGSKNPDKHASDKFIYIDNGDDATHTKKHGCCEAVVDAAEQHDLTSGADACVCGAIKPESVVELTITWTDTEFTYVDGEWNPDTHEYNEGEWIGECTVTIENTGVEEVAYFVTYTSTVDGITGVFGTTENPKSDSVTDTLVANEKKVITFKPEGRPSKALNNEKIGTLTIKLGGD